MRHCQKHWLMTRQAVADMGMSPLVARNGEEAAQQVVDELIGQDSAATFDPLMAAFIMVADRSTSALGLYLLSGDYCPICEVVATHAAQKCEHGCTDEDVEREWVEGPVRACRNYVDNTPELAALLDAIKAPGAEP